MSTDKAVPTVTRTQDEILARFREVASTDLIGFRREVLVDSMDLDTLKKVMPDFAPEGDASEYPAIKPESLDARARGYLEFAIEKAICHRGISASRSVDKLTEFAWLMGRDDVVESMSKADYAQYGVPIVKAFAEGMEYEWEASYEGDQARLDNMAQGKPCVKGCSEGCGR